MLCIILPMFAPLHSVSIEYLRSISAINLVYTVCIKARSMDENCDSWSAKLQKN